MHGASERDVEHEWRAALDGRHPDEQIQPVLGGELAAA